ncbi:TetR/AcrR family transcriptional regulator [Neptunicella sp.]|uniref:TetR/AcrR family transcriptional regulator n=1 Tax=Neptunicella sp. TaxID=2125986 RepID=UPI003F68CB6A
MTAGRKLAFDKDIALDAAMKVFWHKGYVGASLSELTDAMQINKPSLYSAFGNKEALFIQALNKYSTQVEETYFSLLYTEGVDLKQRITNFLTAIVNSQCDDQSPKGCFLCAGVSESANSDIPEAIKLVLDERIQGIYKALREIFQNDPEAMQQGLSSNAEQHARFLSTLLHGTAGLARAGLGPEQLLPVVQQGVRSLELGDNTVNP